MAGINALDVEDLVVEYPSGGYAVRPINGLSLQVDGGNLALLLGASGCGKTTMLSVLAGILTPTSGAVRVRGLNVGRLRGAALADYRLRSVGIVFQAFNLVAGLTALQNVMVPLLAAGWTRAAARTRARDLLEQIDLGERLGHRPGDLSGGQQQRVAIARALALDPPLVLADEPTAHLDYIQVEGVLSLLRKVADQGRIVIVSTHDERIMPLADQVVPLTHRPGTDAEQERRHLRRRQVLFSQGDPGDLVYVIESGEIELVRVRDDHGEEPLGRLGPGQYFGEWGPTFGLPRSATARATRATTVIGYPLREFRMQLRSDAVARSL